MTVNASVSAASAPAGKQRSRLGNASYSDVALVCGVVAIIALMIWPLPLVVIDVLVGISMSLAIGLLLIAIYIPSPIAFSSFPSVLLLSTLFRLALSIAVTRQILLNADGGHIIDTFGNIVAGGNLVVGLVVFLIITVVQFIVVAKGAERVAEVAARFTLDAMPGKQLSIDSDLRSGLLEKEEAKRRRKDLEIESQLYGSLDGAMKFVKGDAIAGIVIIIVNLLGGLAIGMLQLGMQLGDAVQTYSILTIGDGLVAQIPALLSSIAAGLVVTRTASDADDRHLGEAIVRQVSNQPRVLLITGFIALLLMFVPGFPKLVFLLIGFVLLGISAWRFRSQHELLGKLFRQPEVIQDSATLLEDLSTEATAVLLPSPLELRLDRDLMADGYADEIHRAFGACVTALRREYGVPLPNPTATLADLGPGRYELVAAGVRLARGYIEPERVFLPAAVASDGQGPVPVTGSSDAETTEGQYLPALRGSWSGQPMDLAWTAAQTLANHVSAALRRNLSEFIGIQEVANILQQLSDHYPDLVKETLRAVPPQRIAEILKRLVGEGLPIRDLRRIFEAVADAGSREKDILLLSEAVRIALKRHICERYAGADQALDVVQVAPTFEDQLRQSVRVTSSGSQLALDPQVATQALDQMRAFAEQAERPFVVMSSMDVRRHVRSLIESEFFDIPVMSYQELVTDLKITQLGHLGA